MSGAVDARPRAIYRSYYEGSKRTGQVRRLHVIRETATPSHEPGNSTLCGQHAWPVTHSEPVIICPLPERPPAALTWCPKCIGLLAERLGLLGEIAASLAAYDPTLTDLHEQRQYEYIKAQREVRRERLLGQQ